MIAFGSLEFVRSQYLRDVKVTMYGHVVRTLNRIRAFQVGSGQTLNNEKPVHKMHGLGLQIYGLTCESGASLSYTAAARSVCEKSFPMNNSGSFRSRAKA
jgi:hypothetical protein